VHGLPPAALAVAGWGTPADVRLDLRYAPDEADWLDPSPRAVWEAVIAASAGLGAAAAEHYAVDDPYGGERGAPAVARCFGVAPEPEQVSFGAGVTGLLHGLASLAGRGTVLVAPLAHPDLGAWARSRGARIVTAPATGADALARATADTGPAVVGLDRPAFGGEMMTLEDVAAVAGAAARAGGVLVVDEAPATYLDPAASAIRLVASTPGLVVLRGFTKAYSLGGMRVGYAVASPDVAARARAVLAPLQASEPALAVALALLDAGDVCTRLRARIHAVKPVTVALLEAAGLRVRPGHPDIPAVTLDNEGGVAAATLAGAAIAALDAGPAAGILHVRIPIGDDRIAALRDALAVELAAR
jgi:histidinol-phosphate/aromatic aminotransferase/cobyric acid decarboxylase-like protein